MSNKNNKEKSSFWKKLVGKNKSSISSLKTESNLHYDKLDTNSIKSKKRSSGMYSLQQSTPPTTPKPKEQQQQQQQQQQPQKVTMTIVPTMATVDTSPIPTPTIPAPQNKLIDTAAQPANEATPEPDNEQVEQSEQLVVPKDTTQLTQEPVQQPKGAVKNDDAAVTIGTTKNELLKIISNLKLELENNNATVQVLQRQKEAAVKDLDYLELTVDELVTEKNDLIEQLENEKIQSQHHLDDLNLLLQKMKSTADNARDQSFAKDQTKLELETLQSKASEEKESLLVELKQKDKSIRELKSKLNKSNDEVEELKQRIEHLVTTHAEELSRVTRLNEENEKKLISLLNTPQGSSSTELEDKSIPVPTKKPSLDDVYGTPQSIPLRSPKESVEYVDDADLDDQLMKLLKEKEKLQSLYSKIPLSGGGPKSRRRKEEIELMLDHVDSQLSKIKQQIKRS